MSEKFNLSKNLARLDAKIAAKKNNDGPGQNSPSFEIANINDIPHTTGKHDVHSRVAEHDTEISKSKEEKETRNFIESNQQTVSEILTSWVQQSSATDSILSVCINHPTLA